MPDDRHIGRCGPHAEAAPVGGWEEGGANFVPGASIEAVAITNGARPGPQVTRGLIEHIASGQLGGKLRSQVASWHPGVSRDEVDEAFQEACLTAHRSCRGQTEGEVFTWLRTTTHRELAHMERRARTRSRREMPTDVAAVDFQLAVAGQRPEDLLIAREDNEEIGRVTQAVLARLSERQRQIVALYGRGFRRPAIAEHLGMTPRSVKRALERIMAEARDELLDLAGRGCEAGEPLVARLAFGLAGPRETRQAQLHLASCPTCGALYERLDLWREKVAAVLPVPIAEQAHPGIIERALHGAADTLSHARQRLSDGAGTARDHAAEGVTHAKQHAAATYYRAIDPTPLAGVRPGAAAATVAGCLALGGSATYCVELGIDPTSAFTSRASSQRHQPTAHVKRKAITASASPTLTATATPEPTAEPTPTAQSTPQPTRTPQPTPTAVPPAPQDEYEPVSPAADAQATEASSRPKEPAAAPADGPGEFDGP
jgi:RNA polymerase sigma factor (sigma-70 family)